MLSLWGRVARCAALGGALAVVLGTSPAWATGPDAFANRVPLTTAVTDDNFGTSIETPEALTPTSTSDAGCLSDGTVAAHQGELMGATVWYTIAGNNRVLTVTTRDHTTDFDTMLAAYDGNTLMACNDDYRPGVSTASEIRFRSVAGHTYSLQLGSRCPTRACPTPIPAGHYKLELFSAPDNDTRAGATTLNPNNTVAYSNNGATEDAGEPLSCTVANSTRPFAKTVWFKYHAPTNGIATFTTASSGSPATDTVLAVYRGSDASYLGCNDDLNNTGGPSLVTVEVTAGDYYIQVGGYNHNATLAVPTAAEQGSFVPNVGFTPGLDHDHDTYYRPPEGGDCDDTNAAIHPGATEIANNNVDENCDGLLAFDADGDGVLAPPLGADCNDTNASVHPGAREIPYDGVNQDCDSGADDNDADHDGYPKGPDCNDGNAAVHPGARDIPGNTVDENCDGKKALGALDPDPQFSMPNYAQADGALIASPLVVSDVKRGYRITVRCHGGGCPFGAQTKKAKNRKPVRFAGLVDHKLRPGATVSVYVVRPGTYFRGRYARWTVRAGHQTPRVTACLLPPRFKKVIRCG